MLSTPTMSVKQALGLGRTNSSLMRCIEFTKLPPSTLLNDLCRILRPKPGTSTKSIIINQILRGFSPNFHPQNNWLAIFPTVEDARTALNVVSGALIGTRGVVAQLKPLYHINYYKEVNMMVDDISSTILVDGFPTGTGIGEVENLLSGYHLRDLPLGPPIHFSNDGRRALVEFENKNDAHRAYRELLETQRVGHRGIYHTHCDLLN